METRKSLFDLMYSKLKDDQNPENKLDQLDSQYLTVRNKQTPYSEFPKDKTRKINEELLAIKAQKQAL